MKKNVTLFGIAVLLTAIVFSFAACKHDGEETDPALNGTWESESLYSGTFNGVDYSDKTERYTISNGIIVYSLTDVCNIHKASFTTEVIGTMKMTLTHMWGKELSASLEAKWYSQADLKKPAVLAILDASAEDVDEHFARSVTATYSISGSRLTVTWGSGTTEYFNKID